VCGIFGYVGETADLGALILTALERLEYRGYDSWGIAVESSGRVEVEKSPGRIRGATTTLPPSRIGFGHTRWATHGRVSEQNAHPHCDCTGRFAIIHNGIIENYDTLRKELRNRGHHFESETDSEVVAHLIEEAADPIDGLTVRVFQDVFSRLEGLSAVIAMDAVSRRLFAAKRVSPLALGRSESGTFIASDPIAFPADIREVMFLDDDVVVQFAPDRVTLFEFPTLREIAPSWAEPDGDREWAGLDGYPDFMSKEMAEQPAILDRIAESDFGEIAALATAIADSRGAFLVGCGTASYAALTGSYLFSRIAHRHINVVPGAEFKYYEHFLTPETLVIALSQSGETADIIDAMHAARNRGAKLACLVNARHSTLDRMVDDCVYLGAGPEQCVLSTKAYTAKVAVLLMMAHYLAGTPEDGRALVRAAARGLEDMLQQEWIGVVRRVAERVHRETSLFVVGRGLSFPTALEAALKIKEVSYIHAEGFAGGELKHGVIALVDEGTPCVVYAPLDETRGDILSGAMELKARGGYIIGISPRNEDVFDSFIPTPDIADASPIVHALPAQMLGYHAALLRGNDPDKPRNLAKSVTVK
jgi:glutamine---fructose-6-phosphate transaminase (isomerizing)